MNILLVPLIKKETVAHDTVAVSFDVRGTGFFFEPGQFVRLTLPEMAHEDPRGNYRDFSIASMPDDKEVAIVFRTEEPLSGFKKTLLSLPTGSMVQITGPHGVLVIPKSYKQPLVFVAGGIGITAFIGKIEYIIENRLPHKVSLLYGNSGGKKALYSERLRKLEKTHSDRFYLAGKKGEMDRDFIKKNIAEIRGNLWQLAGPKNMIENVKKILAAHSVRDEDVLYEEYKGYERGPGSFHFSPPVTEGTLSLLTSDEEKIGFLSALNSTAIVSETDSEGTIILVNDKFVEVSKYSREELIGQNHRILKSGYHSAEFYKELWNTISVGGIWRGEIKNRAKDGSYYWVDTSIAPIADASGKPVRYISVRFIITDKKKAEEELAAYREQLEYRVERRTAELSAANRSLKAEIERREKLEADLRAHAEKLAEADRKKDEFIAILSHELRNPLSPIVASIELAKLLRLSDPSVVSILGTIDRQVQNMKRLLNDIFDVSRAIRGKMDLQTEKINILEILKRAKETVSPLIEERRQKLTTDMPEKAVFINADPMRLEQALVNVLNNASKYTEPGGRIYLGAYLENNNIIIEVRDTGMGIDPGKSEKLFDLFTQGDSTLRREHGGLGVGLSIAKFIAEAHGGTITARSDGKDRGSTFTFKLPFTNSLSLKMKKNIFRSDYNKDPAAEDDPSTRRKVLVVEDVKELADSISLLLTHFGYDVRTAYNGREALTAVRDFSPNIVLMDIAMPGMDGYETCEELKKIRKTAGAKFIAMTGFGQPQDKQRSKEAGFYAHLVKPVSGADLKNAIETALVKGA